MKKALWFTLLLLVCPGADRAYAVDDEALFGHAPGIWEIEGKGNLSRWIVIHNLDEAKGTGIFHIEVIGRERDRPVWDVKRICRHMAITKEALKKSVTRPLNTGAVYPEPYDDAYAKWKKDAEGGNTVICETSVLECLPAKAPAQEP